jgi:histidinol-phosphate aminotransferase
MGFGLTDSKANFLFAAPPGLSGSAYYEKLKARGILVRYFSGEGLEGHVRISIGTGEQMESLLRATEEILGEARA